ncbi:signal peptidase I [Candidatus Acetothermia bacterium]|nr:signal peptidase I [Candidatus Acetothermia bacterium]
MTKKLFTILGIVLGLALVVLFLAVGVYGVGQIHIPTGAMAPTIPPDSRLLTEARTSPQPGDIILFWHQESSGPVRYIKRLIAIGGQRVQIKGDCYVYVDGQRLWDDAFNHPNHPNPQRQCYSQAGEMFSEEWLVPQGKFFVLGDNTNSSLDSRYFSFIDEKDYIGKPWFMLSPRFGPMNGYFGSAR